MLHGRLSSAHKRLDVTSSLAIGHYTYQKNRIFATTGLTTLNILENENLVARCEEMGYWWKKELNEAVIGSNVLIPPVGEGLLFRLK